MIASLPKLLPPNSQPLLVKRVSFTCGKGRTQKVGPTRAVVSDGLNPPIKSRGVPRNVQGELTHPIEIFSDGLNPRVLIPAAGIPKEE